MVLDMEDELIYQNIDCAYQSNFLWAFVAIVGGEAGLLDQHLFMVILKSGLFTKNILWCIFTHH